jgi:hypothetical protein
MNLFDTWKDVRDRFDKQQRMLVGDNMAHSTATLEAMWRTGAISMPFNWSDIYEVATVRARRRARDLAQGRIVSHIEGFCIGFWTAVRWLEPDHSEAITLGRKDAESVWEVINPESVNEAVAAGWELRLFVPAKEHGLIAVD